jgi:hypothetical protein
MQSKADSTGRLLAIAAVMFASCADTGPTVKPDEMSAARHREEAAREATLARREGELYRPEAARPSPFGDPLAKDYLYTVPLYNPTEGHVAEAEKHRQHARQHEASASYLERFEEVECRHFPPASRAACPLLGPVVRIDDIEGGVRVTFKEGTRVDAVIAHMRCHYAFARARAFGEAAGCPLYLRGIEIRDALDPMAVEIVSGDTKVAGEIRTRSREEAVFVRRDGSGK